MPETEVLTESVVSEAVDAATPKRGRPAKAVEQKAEGTDWILEDGAWKEVPASQVHVGLEPLDSHDPFALPRECNQGEAANFDFIHGSDNSLVMRELERQGWVVSKRKFSGTHIRKNGATYVLGGDAPLMERPFAVAQRYAPKPTEDLLARGEQDTRDNLKDILKDWSRQDREVDSSPDAVLSPENHIDLLREAGNGDPVAGARLMAERRERGLPSLDGDPQERAARRRGPSFTMGWTDEQYARFKASRQGASV